MIDCGHLQSLLSKTDYLLILITIRGISLTMPTGQNFAAYYGALLQRLSVERVTDNMTLLYFYTTYTFIPKRLDKRIIIISVGNAINKEINKYHEKIRVNITINLFTIINYKSKYCKSC